MLRYGPQHDGWQRYFKGQPLSNKISMGCACIVYCTSSRRPCVQQIESERLEGWPEPTFKGSLMRGQFVDVSPVSGSSLSHVPADFKVIHPYSQGQK